MGEKKDHVMVDVNTLGSQDGWAYEKDIVLND